jgi:hypothetical protein
VKKDLTIKEPLPHPWRTSRAKELLRELLLDSSSWVHLLTDEQIHEAEPIFKQYPLKNFKTNYSNMKASTEMEQAAINFDQRTLLSDNTIFPRKVMTERGYLF